MKDKKTIFEILFQKKIYFAVSMSVTESKCKPIDTNSRDYFLTILECDFSKVKHAGFKPNDELKFIYERDLSLKEVNEFKGLKHLFTKVIHNEYGRVYELRSKSFKAYYQSIELNKVAV